MCLAVHLSPTIGKDNRNKATFIFLMNFDTCARVAWGRGGGQLNKAWEESVGKKESSSRVSVTGRELSRENVKSACAETATTTATTAAIAKQSNKNQMLQ